MNATLQRAARAVWWIGTPAILLGWLLAPPQSVIYVSHEPFAIEANTLRTTLPAIAGELLAAYRVAAVAVALMVVVTALSHRRRTRAVRVSSLLLPAYIAAIEACLHFVWFNRRHSFTSPPTHEELHQQFHTAAIASVLAVALALGVAAVLVRCCPAALADRVSWQALSAVAPVAAVVVLWVGADRLFFLPL